jgi:DNA polymerase-3 subunit delta'
MALVHELAEKLGKFGGEQNYEMARNILTGWCERMTRAEARGIAPANILQGDADVFSGLMRAYPPRHFLTTWEKMAQMFLQTEISNLDKRQAILSAFLMLQKPEYQGLNPQ